MVQYSTGDQRVISKEVKRAVGWRTPRKTHLILTEYVFLLHEVPRKSTCLFSIVCFIVYCLHMKFLDFSFSILSTFHNNTILQSAFFPDILSFTVCGLNNTSFHPILFRHVSRNARILLAVVFGMLDNDRRSLLGIVSRAAQTTGAIVTYFTASARHHDEVSRAVP